MAIAIVMPRLGWNMETGTVVEWLKHDGEQIHAGDYLFLVESDKSTTEVEALDSGKLHIPENNLRLGEELPVGALLAYLLQEGEAAPTVAAPATAAPAATQAAPDTSLKAAATSAAEQEPAAAPWPERRPVASPRARRTAHQLGVDWQSLTGSGRTGRIVERDVRDAYTRQQASTAPTLVPSVAPAAGPTSATGTVTPLSTTRRRISERMTHSAQTTAAVTLTTEANATALVALRNDLLAQLPEGRVRPSYTDFFARLCMVALQEFPELNASLTDAGIQQHQAIHIGLAVDTERGLLVPVLRDVQAKSVQQIAAESTALIAEARAGRSTPAALQGSTFTITNLGMYEIDAFTPIINAPECAILGLGRIVPRPIVLDEAAEQFVVGKMIVLSLTFDHRLVDGGPAARFLQRIKQYVESPLLWLTA